jgi:hypothetical protein
MRCKRWSVLNTNESLSARIFFELQRSSCRNNEVYGRDCLPKESWREASAARIVNNGEAGSKYRAEARSGRGSAMWWK